jgi:hypothetical protein
MIGNPYQSVLIGDTVSKNGLFGLSGIPRTRGYLTVNMDVVVNDVTHDKSFFFFPYGIIG